MTLTSSIEHNALLRLAEVYLIYAEALMGNSTSTTNADALLYFNKVRARAGLAPVTSWTRKRCSGREGLSSQPKGIIGKIWQDFLSTTKPRLSKS